MKRSRVLGIFFTMLIGFSSLWASNVLEIDEIIITPAILMEVSHKMSTLNSGETLELLTEAYPAIISDVQAWSRMMGHRFMGMTDEGEYYRFLIEKGEHPRESKRILIVISSAKALDNLTPLAAGLTGAILGDQVSIFFQGPGVKLLYSPYRAGVPGFVIKQLDQIGHAPPQEKIRLIQELGGQLYGCGPSMDRFGKGEDKRIFENVIVCEYFTVYELMENADSVIFLN